MDKPNIFTNNFFLSAAQCDAQSRMPLTLAVNQLINLATHHANILDIGYETLRKHGMGWVLSRLQLEMLKWPGINTPYSVSTWVERWNRMYSERCFQLNDADGNPMGYARTFWSAIDTTTRRVADLSTLGADVPQGEFLPCPVPRPARLADALPEPVISSPYTFLFCDLDFNRHVNTVRYIEHILNTYSLDFFDTHRINAVTLNFAAECRYGQTVHIRTHGANTNEARIDITPADSQHASVAARILCKPVE